MIRQKTLTPIIQLQSRAGFILRCCYNILAALQESYDCLIAYLSSCGEQKSGMSNSPKKKLTNKAGQSGKPERGT